LKGGETMLEIAIILIYFALCFFSLWFGMFLYKNGFKDGLYFEKNGTITENKKNPKEQLTQEDKDFIELMNYNAEKS
jgi:uncharacterized membrane protein